MKARTLLILLGLMTSILLSHAEKAEEPLAAANVQTVVLEKSQMKDLPEGGQTLYWGITKEEQGGIEETIADGPGIDGFESYLEVLIGRSKAEEAEKTLLHVMHSDFEKMTAEVENEEAAVERLQKKRKILRG